MPKKGKREREGAGGGGSGGSKKESGASGQATDAGGDAAGQGELLAGVSSVNETRVMLIAATRGIRRRERAHARL